MHRHALVALSLVLMAPTAAAQDAPPGPAEQVQDFAPMIGTWEGSGTSRFGPDGPEAKWTAKSSVSWTLGGHFVREDTSVEFEGMAQPLVFVNLYGWDRENRRHLMTEAGNLGRLAVIEVRWAASGARISARAHVTGGQLVAERWVHHIEGDTWKLRGEEAVDDGPFFCHVEGELKRVSEKPAQVAFADAAFMPEMAAATRPHIDRILPTVGTYRMKGWFQMGPDMPKMEFSGVEMVEPAFGGTMLEMTSKGDPMPGFGSYEAIGWMAWDEHRGCYTMAFANSMGEIAQQDCRIGDGAWVVTYAGLHMGQPTATRGVIHLGDDGAFESYDGHMMIDTHAPGQFFEASYEKQ